MAVPRMECGQMSSYCYLMLYVPDQIDFKVSIHTKFINKDSIKVILNTHNVLQSRCITTNIQKTCIVMTHMEKSILIKKTRKKVQG